MGPRERLAGVTLIRAVEALDVSGRLSDLADLDAFQELEAEGPFAFEGREFNLNALLELLCQRHFPVPPIRHAATTIRDSFFGVLMLETPSSGEPRLSVKLDRAGSLEAEFHAGELAAIWVTRPDQVFDELGKLTVEWAEPARPLLEAPLCALRKPTVGPLSCSVESCDSAPRMPEVDEEMFGITSP